jgi:AraC-like DNA-binding protein
MVAGLREATPQTMAEDPVGRYVAGDCYAHFCAYPELWGVVLWGRPNEDVARAFGRTLILELVNPMHVSVIDATRIEGADISAFKALAWYMRTNAEQLARVVSRLALVRPRGFSGAMVTGVFDMVVRPYPVQVFDNLEAALAWSDVPLTWLPTFAELHAVATGTPAILTALRPLLERDLANITVAQAARTLSLSERSLQRKLTEAGTTFVAELGAARVRAAQRLLVDSDLPLTTIALEVGCASLQHFSVLFRKHIGEAPSTWRRRLRPEKTEK